MNKFKTFYYKYRKKLVTATATAIVMCASCVSAFAVGEPAVNDISSATAGVTSIFANLKDVFSFTNIISMIAIAIGAAAVLTLGWFGVRKVVHMIQTALKRGKVSV